MVSQFTIFPAIDLRDGRVVRLAQGDPDRQTTYANDPLYWAERWKAAGASWLHIVNLDGAFGEDSRDNLQALELITGIGLNVEFGGGIRDQTSIQTAFDLGIKRVFLGTAGILNPLLVEWAIGAFGADHIAGDIGVCGEKVVIKGWQETTNLTLSEVGQRFFSQGIRWCVLTNVRRDGVSSGVDLESAVQLQKTTGLQVVASGGVNSLEDLRQAHEAGLSGIIIGRALFEGKISLHEALIAFDGKQ